MYERKVTTVLAASKLHQHPLIQSS